MNQLNQERCENCLLPVSYAGISFSRADGRMVCNFCKKHEKCIFKGEECFIDDIGLKKGEKIGVTVSGGKDSIYAWSRLADFFGGSNVVAFNHCKVGLMHPVAMDNLKNASEILKSKLVVIKDESFLPRFRDNLEKFLNFPDPAMIKLVLCMGCRFGISGRMFKAGRLEGITKFVEAGSYLERCSFKIDLIASKGLGDYKKGLSASLKEFPFYSRELIEIDHENWRSPKICEPKGFLDYELVRCLNFFHYFENNPSITEGYVKTRCKWKKQGKGWRFDCKIESIKDLLYLSLLGYTENDCKLSTMIRYGLIERDVAIKELDAINRIILNSKEETLLFIKSIGLGELVPKLIEVIA